MRFHSNHVIALILVLGALVWSDGSEAVAATTGGLSSLRGDPASASSRAIADRPQARALEIHYVEPEGLCGGQSPCHATPQDAFDVVADGALILLATATYEQGPELDVGSFARVELEAGWNSDFTLAGPSRLVLTTDSASEATLRSLTVKSGSFVLVGPDCVTGTDSDGDGLDDCFETNTGVFVSAIDTGTDPNDRDTDGDYLSDGDEVLGTLAGLDLPALGVNPLRKNILIEYDWFDDDPPECDPHSHRPTAAMLERLTATFEAAPVANPDGSTGITMIHDYGQGGLFTGGNLVADTDGVLSGGVNGLEFKNHKLANFASNRDGYFYYVLLPHRYNVNSSSSGQAELPGDDMIVSLYCVSGVTVFVSNTIAHELGHNLNLRHGGNTNCNYKPNYNSVMNYRYQFGGVDTVCTPPPGGVLDYSIGDRIALDETNLLEEDGICGAPLSWDWNGDSFIDTSPITMDVNSGDDNQNGRCGGTLTTLEDHDDWSAIQFTGLASADGAVPRRPSEIVDCDNVPPPLD